MIRTRPAGPTGSFEDAVGCLRAAALTRALDGAEADGLRPLLTGRLARRPRAVELAADATVREVIHELLSRGWTPAELHIFAGRRLDGLALDYFLDALAATAQWSAAAAWFADLAPLGARVWWTVGEPHLGQWARRHRQQRAETIQIAVEVIALLSVLPRTDELQPGTPIGPGVPAGTLVRDGRVVAKIDALLARAAGSDFPDEAVACARKAQQLMVRYAAGDDRSYVRRVARGRSW